MNLFGHLIGKTLREVRDALMPEFPLELIYISKDGEKTWKRAQGRWRWKRGCVLEFRRK